MIGEPDLANTTGYSHRFYKGLKKIHPEIDVIYYAHISEKTFSGMSIKAFWNSRLFPIQVLLRGLIDKPDIIHIQYAFDTFIDLFGNMFFPPLLLLLKLFRFKVIVNIHATVPKKVITPQFSQKFFNLRRFQAILPEILKFFFRYIYYSIRFFSDITIVWGEYFKHILMSDYNFQSDEIVVIPHGVDEHGIDLCPENVEKKYNIEKKFILYFGGITPRKDLITLIKSFGQLRQEVDYNLILAGYISEFFRDYADSIHELVEEMHLTNYVQILGFIPDEVMHCLYKKAEIVILPYIYAFEGPSGPYSYSITYEKPIIASDVGFNKYEFQDESDALLYTTGDPQSLYLKLKLLHRNEGLKKVITRNMALKKQSRLWICNARQTLEIYHTIVQQ